MREDYAVCQENYRGYNIYIIQDTAPMSPEIDAEDVFLVSDHRDITITNDLVTKPSRTFCDTLMVTLPGVGVPGNKRYHAFNLFGYSHSGVSLSLSNDEYPFNCPWDGFYTGTVFITTKFYKTRDGAREVANSLVEEWNHYLSGNVWGYIITKNELEDIDSCWGFVGDYKYCLEEARNIVDYYANNEENKEVKTISTERQALVQCFETLKELAKHPAFEDDAPEFNEGGIGYEACEAAREALGVIVFDRPDNFDIAEKG